MCVGHRFISGNHAGDYLHEASKALNRYQYQKCLNRLELAAKEIEIQKESLTKFTKNELQFKEKIIERTEENIAKLKKLNDHLRLIQNEAQAEVEKIRKALKDRLREQKDYLTDYEIEIQITFYLREDDPEYCEDEDNILVKLDCLSLIGFYDADEDYDYNDQIGGWLSSFRHCALFHALYDHVSPGLHWSDMLRIGGVWVDIHVQYQKSYNLESGELIKDNFISQDDNGLHYKLTEEG